MTLYLYGSDAVIFARSGKFLPAFSKVPACIPAEHVPELPKEGLSFLNEQFGIVNPVHVCVMTKRCRRNSHQLACHCHGSSLTKSGYLPIGNGLYCAAPELAVAQFAAQLSRYDMPRTNIVLILALTITELASTYFLDETSRDVFTEREQVLSIQKLNRLLEESKRFPGKGALQVALSMAHEGSRSPAETLLVLFASAPKEYGGHGIPGLDMNGSVKTIRSAGPHTRHPDIRNEQHKVILEYNGSYHEGQRANDDDNRRNELIAKGYTVLVINKDKLFNANALEIDLDTMAALTFSSTAKPIGYETARSTLRALTFEFNNTRARENTRKLIPAEFKPVWFYKP